jgi:acetyl-CoA decarbonylase/synthase complex subunit beta
MAATTAYHHVNVMTGLKAAKELTEAQAVVDTITKAERPLLILGGSNINYLLNEKPLVEYLIKLSRAGKIPMVATADTKLALTRYGVKPESTYDAVEIVHRLKDPEWKGVLKEGNHDLVMFCGFRSDLGTNALSVLKHFAPHLKTLTLCKYYYPNADFSLTNIRKDEQWAQLLEEVITKVAEAKGVAASELELAEAAAAAAPTAGAEEGARVPQGVGPQFEGEVIRKADLFVDVGGPKPEYKCEFIRVKPMDEVEHMKVEVIGPDLTDMTEGEAYPIAVEMLIAGEKLEEDMEGVLERRMHDFSNYVEGIYHMNQQDEMWIRIGKNAYEKGMTSLAMFGRTIIDLYTSQFSLIEKMSMNIITDPERCKEVVVRARDVYEARRARARGLKEEEVDEFYGCVLCQSFAPSHLCMISPERIANCGAINWFDGRAAAKMDPEGPIFAVPKGECLNPVSGEYSGTDEVIKARSLGAVERVNIHANLEYPHTSCGCFQAICFYIPEVDGFGIVHRDYKGDTVVGLPFSKMAAEVSGGRQVEGQSGLALEYMRSPKFYQADGGLYRVVWMPKSIKEKFQDAIPEDLLEKIATEDDVKDTDGLMAFLEEKGHPWLAGEVELPEA